MELVKKKLVVGLSKRADWEKKLQSVLEELVGVLGLELDEGERTRLAGVPGAVANLIYAGLVEAVVVEFGGAACELSLVYYPDEEEEDDLDLSLLQVADWDVDSLKVRLRVEDADYAASVVGSALQQFSSGCLTVELEPKPGDGEGKPTEDEEAEDADELADGEGEDANPPAEEGNEQEDNE
jgi:hypothetical protein